MKYKDACSGITVLCYYLEYGWVQYLLFTCSGWRAVKRDELLQVFLQAGFGGVPMGRLGAPEISPELWLTAQQTITLVPSGHKTNVQLRGVPIHITHII